MLRRLAVIVACLMLCIVLGTLAAQADPNGGGQKESAQLTQAGDGRLSASATEMESEDQPVRLTKAQVMTHLNLADVAIREFDIVAQEGDPFEMSLNIEGADYTLDLRPHSVRSADFQLLVADDDGIHEEEPAPHRTYRGVVLDADGSEIAGSGVAASLNDGKLTGLIDLNDGQTWYIDSLVDVGLPAQSNEHALYKGIDSLPHDRRCGVDDMAGVILESDADADESQPEGEGGGGPRATGFEVADIAIEADWQFFLLNGSSVTATMFDIENVMNSIEFVYERDTDITYEITTIVVRTSSASNPYTTNNCGDLVCEFKNEWNTNFTGVRRDMAHLMTGRNLLSGCLGVAWLGVVCNVAGNDGSCPPIANLGYGLAQNRWSASFNNRIGVSAHELGHNWAAFHCDGNGDCHIMCSSIGFCNGLGLPNFGVPSINSIVAHKNSRTCLFPSVGTLDDPIVLPFNDTIISPLSTINWIYVDGGAASTAAVNEPSGSWSINLDSTGSGEHDQDEVRTNFMLLSGETAVDVEYWTEHRGVESSEQLIVEYWSSGLAWVNLNNITSTGVDQNDFVFHTHLLTTVGDPNAFHDEFRLRFRASGNNSNDDWYIDNVQVKTSGADLDPPTPDPMTFATTPTPNAPNGETEITMTATTATDPSGVEYFFTNLSGAGGTSSAWQVSTTYVDDGLTPNTNYSYNVKARDTAPTLNETAASGTEQVATQIQTPTTISFGTITDTSIQVTADGTFTNIFSLQSGMFFEMIPAAGSGANVWVPNAVTTTVTSLSPGTLYTFRAKARNREGVETGFGSAHQASTTGGVTGACCHTDGSCTVDTEANCNAAGGTYQGDGTTCAGVTCPQPGACCETDGTCTMSTQVGGADCTGTYQGDDTTCAGVTCPQPGACCATDGTCTMSTQVGGADCTGGGGTYQGDDTTCTPNPCPQPCLLLGDINGDNNIDGADIPGYVRAKLSQPAEAGENQDCADYGTGTIAGDNAAFIVDLLN